MTTVRSSVRGSCLAVRCRQWRGRNAGGRPGLLTDGRVTSFPFLPFVFLFAALACGLWRHRGAVFFSFGHLRSRDAVVVGRGAGAAARAPRPRARS